MAGRLLSRPVSAGAVADAPATVAWQIFIDTARWTDWGPSIRAVRCPERYLYAGSRGAVRLAFGPWLSFAVERWDPPVYWDWRVAGVRATGHRVTPLEPNRCRVAFEVPPLAAPYLLVCRLAARRIARLAEAAASDNLEPPRS